MVKLNKYKHFHCIGLGGIGLSGIAEILLARGYQVSGSDMKSSEITSRLVSRGATFFEHHHMDHIDGADAIIYSAAISKENPELKAAIEKDIPVFSRAEILGALMMDYPNSIAISGTHGKTTTTSMVSLILENNHLDPTILVGGNLSQIHGNVKIGEGPHFVTEACEYMDSFLSMRPNIEIILNIDSDHLDYFKDIDHIVSSFEQFADLVPKDGTVIAYAANPFVNSLLNNLSCNVITFGFDETCDYFANEITFNSLGMPSFDVYHCGEKLCNVQLSVPGEHNIANAMGAFACTHSLGVSPQSITATLESFTGTQRRFDIIGITKSNIKIVDDYAHHPTEIKATLSAAQNVPHNNLWCVFQPHTYTRTLALFDDFSTSFELADKVIITDIYAAREKNIYKIHSKDLVDAIKTQCPGKEVFYIESFQMISDFILGNASESDLVITMGAGDVYKVAELLIS